MSTDKKRIGILTSGGDAPGMNAAIRAVTLAGIKAGYEVFGIFEGYKGLVNDNMRLLFERDVDDIIDKSGTILYSDRCDEFNTPEGMAKAAANCRKNNITGLVTIGGDGTLSGATEFSMDYGIPCVGIPGSIDNDLVVSDYTVGFDTAMNTVIDMADNARYTCNSHRRGEVIEVMGRGAGDIALNTGIASGANAIILKESGFEKDATFKKVISHLEALRKAGKRDFIIVLAEGVPLDIDTPWGKELGERLTAEINYFTGDNNNPAIEAKRAANPTDLTIFRPDRIETKFVRLAHLVRGGIPTLRDRVTASKMGVMAVDMLKTGDTNKVLVEQDGKFVGVDINYSLSADKIYKLKMNRGYYEKKQLNAKMMGDYEKYQKKYDKFSKTLTDAQKAEIEVFTDRKLAEFRAAAAQAEILDN